MFKPLRSRRVRGLIRSALFVLLAALFLPLQLFAQAPAMHHHYKLIDLGTFGGPKSYTIEDWNSPFQNLNNQGTFAGWADTSTPDPYSAANNAYQSFCFNDDCYVSHAFEWQNSVRTDLGVIHQDLSSAAIWVSANGLIAGAAQNGKTDPLDPGIPKVRADPNRGGDTRPGSEERNSACASCTPIICAMKTMTHLGQA